MNEKRLSQRLVRMWDKLAELHPPPMFAHFNQAAISDIWQQCAILEVTPGAESLEQLSLKFEYIGDDARLVLTDAQEGKRFTAGTTGRSLKKMFKGLDEVVFGKQTIVNSGSLVGTNNKVLKYRVCLLPFTDNSGHVINIVVGFSWIEC